MGRGSAQSTPKDRGLGKCLPWGSPSVTDPDAEIEAWAASGLWAGPERNIEDLASPCFVEDQPISGPTLKKPRKALMVLSLKG